MKIIRLSGMQKLLVTTALLACFLTVSLYYGKAIEAQEAYEFLPRWQEGQKLNFEVTKSRRKAQADEVKLDFSGRNDLEIEVLSAGEDGYTLAWSLGETKFDGPKKLDDPITKQLSHLLDGYRMILKLDPRAGVTGLENWEEMQERSEKTIDGLTKMLSEAGLEDDLIKNIRGKLSSAFTTKENIERFCTQDAQLFFAAYGIRLEPRSPFRYEASLPNPFGEEPYPAKAQFTLEKIDPAADKAVITWEQTISPEKAQRILEKTAKSFAGQMGGGISGEELLNRVSIEDRAKFDLEISSGWMNNFVHKRTVKIDTIFQEDTITISRKESPRSQVKQAQ